MDHLQAPEVADGMISIGMVVYALIFILIYLSQQQHYSS